MFTNVGDVALVILRNIFANINPNPRSGTLLRILNTIQVFKNVSEIFLNQFCLETIFPKMPTISPEKQLLVICV